MMKLFVINGHNQVGKDTFVNMISDIAAQHQKTIVNYSTVDYVKYIAGLFGWEGEKDNKSRKMLSQLKDMLTEWRDIPYTKCCQEISYWTYGNAAAMFIHCREPEEIKRFVKDYNATTILVERNNIEQCLSNHADKNVLNYNYDIIINNSRGLAELEEEAKIFYDTFIKD